ncbi:MAG: YIP1 family protein [Candidatus Micrarchaeota archaeon]
MTDIDDIADRYLKIVDKIMGFIPYDMKPWKEFFFNPASVVRKDMKEFWPRMADMYVFEAISAVIAIAIIIPSALINMLFLPAPENERLAAFMPFFAAFGAAAGIVLGVGLTILFAMLGPFITAAYAGLEYLVARLLKGAGNYKEHFNASVLPTLGVFVILLPITLAIVPVSWFESIPAISCCMALVQIPLGIISALLGLYGLYLKYKAFVVVHKTGQWSTIAIIFVPMLLLVGLFILAAVLLYASLFALLFNAAALGGI